MLGVGVGVLVFGTSAAGWELLLRAKGLEDAEVARGAAWSVVAATSVGVGLALMGGVWLRRCARLSLAVTDWARHLRGHGLTVDVVDTRLRATGSAIPGVLMVNAVGPRLSLECVGEGAAFFTQPRSASPPASRWRSAGEGLAWTIFVDPARRGRVLVGDSQVRAALDRLFRAANVHGIARDDGALILSCGALRTGSIRELLAGWTQLEARLRALELDAPAAFSGGAPFRK